MSRYDPKILQGSGGAFWRALGAHFKTPPLALADAKLPEVRIAGARPWPEATTDLNLPSLPRAVESTNAVFQDPLRAPSLWTGITGTLVPHGLRSSPGRFFLSGTDTSVLLGVAERQFHELFTPECAPQHLANAVLRLLTSLAAAIHDPATLPLRLEFAQRFLAPRSANMILAEIREAFTPHRFAHDNAHTTVEAARLVPHLLRGDEMSYCVEQHDPQQRARAISRIIDFKNHAWTLACMPHANPAILKTLAALPVALRVGLGQLLRPKSPVPCERSLHLMQWISKIETTQHNADQLRVIGPDAQYRVEVCETAWNQFDELPGHDTASRHASDALWNGRLHLRFLYLVNGLARARTALGDAMSNPVTRPIISRGIFDHLALTNILGGLMCQCAPAEDPNPLRIITTTLLRTSKERDEMWDDIKRLKASSSPHDVHYMLRRYQI